MTEHDDLGQKMLEDFESEFGDSQCQKQTTNPKRSQGTSVLHPISVGYHRKCSVELSRRMVGVVAGLKMWDQIVRVKVIDETQSFQELSISLVDC